MELARENIAVYLSSHTFIETSGDLQTFRCSCNPEKAARKHRCQSCKCLGNCTLSCGWPLLASRVPLASDRHEPQW